MTCLAVTIVSPPTLLLLLSSSRCPNRFGIMPPVLVLFVILLPRCSAPVIQIPCFAGFYMVLFVPAESICMPQFIHVLSMSTRSPMCGSTERHATSRFAWLTVGTLARSDIWSGGCTGLDDRWRSHDKSSEIARGFGALDLDCGCTLPYAPCTP